MSQLIWLNFSVFNVELFINMRQFFKYYYGMKVLLIKGHSFLEINCSEDLDVLNSSTKRRFERPGNDSWENMERSIRRWKWKGD